MPKRYLRRLMPKPDKFKSNKALAVLGSKIYDPDLWHLHRRSVAKAFFNGIFWAAIPMPFQMIAASLCAIPLRANLPLSLALVWITNPFTMPFVFYGNYLIGTLIVGKDSNKSFTPSIEWIWDKMEHIWLPLYVGSVVTGVVVGAIAYFSILIIWRLHVIKRWQERRKNKKNNNKSL